MFALFRLILRQRTIGKALLLAFIPFAKGHPLGLTLKLPLGLTLWLTLALRLALVSTFLIHSLTPFR
jgi:hypothetical protein